MSRIAAKFGILSLAFLAVTGCGTPQRIGPDAETASLKGETKKEILFTNGTYGDHVFLNGDSLKPSTSYFADNINLTINGNFPTESVLTLNGGKLEITGNVGDHSEIRVHLPTATHREKYRKYSPVHKRRVTRRRTVEDSLAYGADKTPGIIIGGSVGNNSKLISNAGIDAECANSSVKMATGWNRPILVRNNSCD